MIYGDIYHPMYMKADYKSDSTGKLWNFTLEQSHASDVPYLYYEGPEPVYDEFILWTMNNLLNQ